jgi:hypothetical protein
MTEKNGMTKKNGMTENQKDFLFFVTLERFLRSFPWHVLRQVGLCLFK